MTTPHPGYRIADLPIGKSTAYKLIAEGALRAVKVGGATIVTNWPAYLDRQPSVAEAGHNVAAAVEAHQQKSRARRRA